MELSVKINAAIDGFVSAMKQASADVQSLQDKAAAGVKIEADTSGAKAAIDGLSNGGIPPIEAKVGADTEPAKEAMNTELPKGAEEAGKKAGTIFGSSLTDTAKSGLALAGGAAIFSGVMGAVGGLGSFLEASFDSVNRIERINAQTEQVIKSTGSAANVTAEHVEELAGNLENLTASEAEGIQTGANFLLTFKDIKNGVGEGNQIFDEAVGVITDMTRALDKTGKAELDTSGAALQLGKALNDPTAGVAALARVGVTFTEQQKQQISTMQESGNIMGAQKLIIAELNSEFGGSAAAFAKTTAGQIELAKHALGTAGEAVVEMFQPIAAYIAGIVADALNGFAEMFGNVRAFFVDNSKAIQVVLSVIGVGAVIAAGVLYGSLIPAVIASASSFVMMGVSAAAAWIAVNAPIILIVAGVAALAAGIFYLYDSFEGVRKVVDDFWNIAVVVFDGLVQYAKDYWEILKAVGEIVFNVLILPFKLLWAVLSPVISAIGDFISSFFSLSDSGKEAGGVIDYVKGAFEVLHNVMGFVISALKGVIAGISTFAETATKVIDKVMSLDFSGAVDAAKEGGKKIGDSTAGAFNESMKEIKSKEAAKKFEEDFKAAAEAVQAAIVSIDASKLAESFEKAKQKAGETATATIGQLSGIQVAFEKLQKAQSEDLPERMQALEAFNTASGAQNVTSYEQAKALVKQTQADLKKSQAENLDASRKMKAIENSNSIEFANKERQINEQTALKKQTDAIEQNRQAQEKIARDTLQSEMDLNIQLLQIQGEADAAKFDAQIASAKKLLSLKLDLTPAQKKAELQSIAEIQTAKDKAESDNLLKIQAERAKFAVKDYEEAQKAIAERLKLESEFAKKTVELTEKRTVETTQQELDKQADLINAKLDFVQAGYNQEINDLLAKNKGVMDAESALKNALAKGNDENTAKAKAALDIARNDAMANDAAILELRIKSSESLQKVQEDAATALSAFRISLIEDDAEREREIRLLEVQKTLDAELLAAAGNERLILDAHRKANAARYDSDEEYNRRTTDLATRTANTLQNLGMGIADGIAEMYGNTFNDLSKAFDDYAAGVQKKMESSGKEDTAKLEDETKTLRSQLAKREISYQDFQEKIAAIREKGEGNGAASATERANLAIGKSFQKLGKDAQEDLQGVFAKMKTSAKAGENVWDTFSKNSAGVFAGMATTLTGTLGAMAAAGTLTLKEVGKAAVGIALDTAGNVAMSQAPVILAAAMTPPPTGLGPIFGAIAGVAAIASIQALIAITKGAIGADAGVVGIDGNYSTPRSSRDTIPIWVRDGESIINPEATAQNRALLKFINSTNRPASEFFSNSVVTANGNLQLAHSNQIRTAQLVTAGSVSGGQDFGAMQNSLANIERSLANAKILETKSKHVSAVDVRVYTEPGLIAKQNKAALRLERARK